MRILAPSLGWRGFPRPSAGQLPKVSRRRPPFYAGVMAWIETIAAADATGELAELYRQMRDPDSGEVDHILQIHALHPAGLRAHFQLYRAVMRGSATLPAVDRELIALVVSQQNRCRY